MSCDAVTPNVKRSNWFEREVVPPADPVDPAWAVGTTWPGDWNAPHSWAYSACPITWGKRADRDWSAAARAARVCARAARSCGCAWSAARSAASSESTGMSGLPGCGLSGRARNWAVSGAEPGPLVGTAAGDPAPVSPCAAAVEAERSPAANVTVTAAAARHLFSVRIDPEAIAISRMILGLRCALHRRRPGRKRRGVAIRRRSTASSRPAAAAKRRPRCIIES